MFANIIQKPQFITNLLNDRPLLYLSIATLIVAMVSIALLVTSNVIIKSAKTHIYYDYTDHGYYAFTEHDYDAYMKDIATEKILYQMSIASLIGEGIGATAFISYVIAGRFAASKVKCNVKNRDRLN